jgi:hypothetical protein
MRPGLEGYIMRGEPVGHFLTAILEGDLYGAHYRADGTNRHKIGDYVTFMYRYAPAICFGNRERVAAWADSGGYLGRLKTATEKV